MAAKPLPQPLPVYGEGRKDAGVIALLVCPYHNFLANLAAWRFIRSFPHHYSEPVLALQTSKL
jgi:hypothetical protein